VIYGTLGGRLQVSADSGAGGPPGGTARLKLTALECVSEIELSMIEAYALSVVIQCINVGMSPAGVKVVMQDEPYRKVWKASDWPA
jgi:hypothetical protein